MSEWVNNADLENRLGNKLLLAGLSEAGKTAVKKLYFQNSKIEDIKGLNATLNYERLNTTINNVPITILDLGGQRVFIKRFLSGFSPFVFSSVRGLIFLIDTSAKATRNNSIQYFSECLKKLEQFSPKSEIFVFLHKTDLIKSQPNYDTVLQLLMEQFQIESQKKIRFFFTSIYEPQSVFNAFLRIFEVLIPENLSAKLVGQIEQYASVKFTSKNVDVIARQTEEINKSSPKEILVQTAQSQYAENPPVNEQKIAGDLDALMHIQSLMKQAFTNSDGSEIDLPEKAKFQTLIDLQKNIKEGLAEKVQVLHNRNLSYIAEIFQEETANDIELEHPDKSLIKEQVSKQILDSLQNQIKKKGPVKETTSTTGEEEEKEQDITEIEEEPVRQVQAIPTAKSTVEEFSQFYGIDKESADSIISHKFVDVFNELVMRSSVPIEPVLQVLNINIPFLKVLGNDISVITDHIIILVFKYYMIGKINEKQIYQSLDYFVKNPDKKFEEIIKEVKEIKEED